ncbi:hypothetical protein G6F63_015388 [Rhizopus arrhizus]|nr:hypothetical protein G6F63_015388 [Rhizopus arrhizus]
MARGARPADAGYCAGAGPGKLGGKAGPGDPVPRPRRSGLLSVGPVADRGLCRVHQAGARAGRYQQHRHQFPPEHVKRGVGLQAHAGCGCAARLL